MKKFTLQLKTSGCYPQIVEMVIVANTEEEARGFASKQAASPITGDIWLNGEVTCYEKEYGGSEFGTISIGWWSPTH